MLEKTAEKAVSISFNSIVDHLSPPPLTALSTVIAFNSIVDHRNLDESDKPEQYNFQFYSRSSRLNYICYCCFVSIIFQFYSRSSLTNAVQLLNTYAAFNSIVDHPVT